MEEALLLPRMDEKYSKAAVSFIFAFPALGGMLYGYDIGATSYVVPQLSNRHAGVSWGVKHSAVLKAVITSGGVGGSLIGAAVAFWIGDDLGRRKEILLGSLLNFCGSLGEALAPSLAVLICGRIIYGAGSGLIMHGAPAYIAEMSPKSIRGTLVSLKEAVIVIGICLGYLVGFSFSQVRGGWRFTYAAPMPVAAICMVGMLWLPPSARWLALKQRLDDAQRALNFVYQESPPLEAIVPGEPERGESVLKHWKALRAGLGVVLLQQLTGQPSVLYYSTEILSSIGPLASLFVGVFKLIATLAAVSTVDSYGRRFLLFTGISSMLVALIGLVLAFASFSGITFKVAVIGFIFVYIAGYQFGFGPVAWLLISECFPLSVRAPAVALAVETNFCANLVVTFLFPIALSLLPFTTNTNLAILFFIFALLGLFSIGFVFLYVPETKGRSLEEIEELFKNL